MGLVHHIVVGGIAVGEEHHRLLEVGRESRIAEEDTAVGEVPHMVVAVDIDSGLAGRMEVAEGDMRLAEEEGIAEVGEHHTVVLGLEEHRIAVVVDSLAGEGIAEGGLRRAAEVEDIVAHRAVLENLVSG